jgi:tetratricopeptide (TPR) repeat protein
MRPQLDAIATLLDQGAADSAVRLLRSAWEPELPTHDRIPMYCMWIRALCETGDLTHGLTLARRAAEEFPREPDILTALGNVHDLAGDLDAAREAFELAVDADPSGPLRHYNHGAVLERLGDEDEAEQCYRRAIELDENVPSMTEANAALGALLRRQGRLEEAEDTYDAYLEEDPLAVEMMVEHGICLSDLDRLEEAVERFETAIGLEADHGGAWYNLAITLYRLCRYADARGAMAEAHRIDPRNPLTLAVLGAWTLADGEGDLDEALHLLYRAIESIEVAHANDIMAPSYASMVCEEVFEALWHHGRREEAREIARLAGRRDWITPHMLDTLNRADHGSQPAKVEAFEVSARALVDIPDPPDDWPRDANGYTTDLTVLAGDEDEALHLTQEYLSGLDPKTKLRFDVRVLGRAPAQGDLSRARGVTRVLRCRAYFRGAQ